MKKRVFPLLLALLILLILVPVSALASDVQASGFCGNAATWTFKDSHLHITGSGAMYESYTQWAWDEYADQVETITIDPGITTIGKYAFSDFVNLKTVSLPDSLMHIYTGAFMGCKSLEAIDLPSSLQSLYEMAFANCSSLTTVVLPKGLQYMELMSFSGCESLEKFVVAEDHPYLSTDSRGVLYSTDKTLLYMVPGGLSGEYTIPDTVLEVYPYAFYGCNSVTSVSVPATVEYAESYSFLGSTSLQSIWVSEAHPFLSSDSQGLLYNKDKTQLVLVPGGKAGTIHVADTVVIIGDDALFGCMQITGVTLPDNLLVIGSYAFAECISLENITIPESVISIGDAAFSYCFSLLEIHLPASINHLGTGIFESCLLLTNVQIDALAEGTLPQNTFMGCINLQDVILPEDLTTVGDYAFYGCISLNDILLPQAKIIGSYAFYACANLQKLNLPAATQIQEYAFYMCVGLQSLDLPEVLNVGKYAFYACENLSQISLPKCFTISEYGFSECTALIQVDIPCATQLETKAFYQCRNLTTVNMPAVKTISMHVFADCRALKQVNMSKVIQVGSYAFAECVSLESIDLPVASMIHEGAFQNCSSIQSVSAPNVREISDKAFQNCTELVKLNIPACYTVGKYAFSNCSKVDKVEFISREYLVVKTRAFENCGDLSIYTTCRHGGFARDAYANTTVTITYPANKIHRWDDSEYWSYGGKITWIPYYIECEEHDWNAIVHKTGKSNCFGEPIYQQDCQVCGGWRTVEQGFQNGYTSWIYNHQGELEYIEVDPRRMATGDTVNRYIFDTVPVAETVDSGILIKVALDKGITLNLEITTDRVSDDVAIYKIHQDGSSSMLTDIRYMETGVQVTLTESCQLVVARNPHAIVNPFTDVGINSRFKDAILWAYSEGITSGTSATTFSPNDAVTRAQFVTLLWRAAGQPEPASQENPFTDVGDNNRFRDAILWAYHAGITSGVTETTFCPDNTCTRGQVAMFLYRYAGSPNVETAENPFADVSENNRFRDAVVWALQAGITAGKTETTFDVGSNCIRAQVVTFLYRYMGQD